jgi:hypothetical protein
MAQEGQGTVEGEAEGQGNQMIFQIDGGKSVRVPMSYGTKGSYYSDYLVKVRKKDLKLFPIGTLFRQINQHKEKSMNMCLVPGDSWLEVIHFSNVLLSDECVLLCSLVETNLEYLEKKVRQKEKKC